MQLLLSERRMQKNMSSNSEKSQREHINLLQQQRKKDVSSATYEINKKYEKYVQGADELLGDVIEALDKKYRGMVVHQLYAAGCYDDENEHTAMQESRMAVWTLLQKSRTENRIDPSFSDVCKGIYYHKVMDVVRSVLTKNKRFGGGVSSIDVELPSENGTVGSLIEDPMHKGNRPENVIEDAEKRSFFDSAFEMYCRALTESGAEPPRCLALYYARILPHVLQICFSVETIPDSKAASPKWAIEKMGKRTVGVLSIESENQMHSYVSKRLTWCDAYQNQLNECVATSKGEQVMRYVIFVDQYDEKQIGHMTDYMHKVVAKDWLRMMKKDSKMIENAVEYTMGSDKLSKTLRGGLGR